MFLKSSLIIIITTLLSVINAHGDHHKCTHNPDDHPKPEIMGVDEDFSFIEEGRSLAAVSYPQIRMRGYYGYLNSYKNTYQAYLQQKLIPPIIDYFQAALKVKYPLKTPIKFAKTQKLTCNEPTPSELYTGVSTDFYWMFKLSNDKKGVWVASSTPCFLSDGAQRPFVAKTTFNTALFVVPSASDIILHEKNIICTMHELTHNLGFSVGLYPHFVDSKGKTRKGHILKRTLGGVSTTVINVEPLTSRLRKYFGCPTLAGAYMENSGSGATDGSHFERRQFGFEYMTSGLIYEMAVSEFSLALLEGSGWYVPNFSYADNFFFGQGQGCNFLTQKCSSSTFKFEEFCTGSSRGCAQPGRGGGVCNTDSRSDSCRFVHPVKDYDCENPSAKNFARLPALQTFGRGTGSKCFTGTLTSSSIASSTSFCFKYSCSGSGSTTKLTVTVGAKSIACTKKSKVKIAGYNGTIDCPDPVEFCKTIGKKACPRGCMGRGTCSNGKCVCKKGFKGVDCALSI